MIDLWYAFQSDVSRALLDRYRSLLAPEELARADRFVFERHRDEYLLTRALVRTSLTRVVPEVAPAAWRFEAGPHGRPHVAPSVAAGRAVPSFNLSNAGGMVVCALAADGELGVDVEPLAHAGRILEVQEDVFSEHERARLAELSVDERRRHAVALWTSKEAYVKARTIGLSLPLREISVTPPDRLAFAPGFADQPERWMLSLHDLDSTHLVAVCATRSEDTRVVLRQTIPEP